MKLKTLFRWLRESLRFESQHCRESRYYGISYTARAAEDSPRYGISFQGINAPVITYVRAIDEQDAIAWVQDAPGICGQPLKAWKL